MPRRVRVGFLFGGKSGEHEVSLASARSAMAALDQTKYEVVPIGIDKQGRWLAGEGALKQLHAARAQSPGEDGNLAADGDATAVAVARSQIAGRGLPLSDVDVVFPILHGPLGEDGTVQGLLELADIPYVGAGVAASAVGMDKELLKRVFSAHQLPIVKYIAVKRRLWEQDPQRSADSVEAALPYPVFVKPANMGSSVGISKARDRAELHEAIKLAADYDRKIIVEQAINAREVECSVLGNDEPIASVVGEIRPHREFYDYVAKYTDGEADLIIPADLPAAQSDEIRQLALRAYRAVDCAGMARVDFFLERGTGRVIVNELNTIPGFTRFSMYTKLWEASGLTYAEVIDRLIVLALERYADKKRSGL
ncbi:MAG: D-alanine--D-alanine ligase [Chloroflexi bacterium]|nr:D-alanine--D-alanine ligase [Chloroflexota bacterium]MBI3733072.1 D-alanine--D-alanine ligase [Chloroflexota bacterium]